MSNPLQDARDLVEKPDSLYKDEMFVRGQDALQLLPALTDYAEQWQARCIELKAKELYPFSMPCWENLPEEDGKRKEFCSEKMIKYQGKKSYRLQAARELEAEAGTWKKIGELEKEAIQMAIDILDQSADSLEEEMAMKILRKLLEGLPCA